MPNHSQTTKKLLGQILVEHRVISQENLDVALARQAQTKELLGTVLVHLGFIPSESAVLPFVAGQLDVEWVDLKKLEIEKTVIEQFPARFAFHYKALPIRWSEGTLSVALTDPGAVHILDEISLVFHSPITPVLSSHKDILEALGKYYGIGGETIEEIREAAPIVVNNEPVIADINEISSEATIGKFVNQILLEAYKQRATDIHLKPFEKELVIRYRIDGILYETKTPVDIYRFKDSINSRIKILAHLNIAEKRLPQDGRFKVRVGETDLDLRVSFLPTPFGESVVVRILNSRRLLSLEELGLSSTGLFTIDRLIQKPHGIIFVTGPTGSGKTTTLYAGLSRINKPDKNILTIEDPIEYQLKGIIQIQVNPAIGLTFAQGLRSMLRHDPDMMMVGEVRDPETAEIAIQVALTGHLVLSTLHTNDAASAATRLIDMGIEPYLVASSVECFIAQRLIRLICPHCKEPVRISTDLGSEFEVTPQEMEQVTIFRGKGCEQCQGTGYQGMQALYEILVLNDELRAMIAAKAAAGQIKEKAVKTGMKTLRQDGWEKIKKGLTTPSEVLRVT